MRANTECNLAFCLDVFLNGEQVKDAVQADEEAGEVWAAYRGVDGRIVWKGDAESGALIYQDIQVIKLTGKVEIRITPPPDRCEQCVRRAIEQSYKPLEIEEVKWASRESS